MFSCVWYFIIQKENIKINKRHEISMRTYIDEVRNIRNINAIYILLQYLMLRISVVVTIIIFLDIWNTLITFKRIGL